MTIDTTPYMMSFFYVLFPEDDGYSALALQFPGVISEGDNESEATANIKDAFIGWAQYVLCTEGALPASSDLDHSHYPIRWATVELFSDLQESLEPIVVTE